MAETFFTLTTYQTRRDLSSLDDQRFDARNWITRGFDQAWVVVAELLEQRDHFIDVHEEQKFVFIEIRGEEYTTQAAIFRNTGCKNEAMYDPAANECNVPLLLVAFAQVVELVKSVVITPGHSLEVGELADREQHGSCLIRHLRRGFSHSPDRIKPDEDISLDLGKLFFRKLPGHLERRETLGQFQQGCLPTFTFPHHRMIPHKSHLRPSLAALHFKIHREQRSIIWPLPTDR